MRWWGSEKVNEVVLHLSFFLNLFIASGVRTQNHGQKQFQKTRHMPGLTTHTQCDLHTISHTIQLHKILYCSVELLVMER